MVKKVLCFLMAFFISFNLYARNSSRRGSSAGRFMSGTRGAIRTVTAPRPTVSIDTETISEFDACMNDICISEAAEDKGRCRCSSQLVRIEKVLRDIEEIQNQADTDNKMIEAMMNVSNTAMITDTVGSVYDNINSIERKAKTIASRKLADGLLVMEGLPLHKEAIKRCSSFNASLSKSDKEKTEAQYMTLIEKDCSAYTTVLKEKADGAQNLLVQSQKNREMFDEQEYKKRNQLDTKSCYVEYEACAKIECGINYRYCKNQANFKAVIRKCEAINYGKCEDNKVVVLLDLKEFVRKELKKEELIQSCRSSLGHLVNGKCLFKVRYVADKCRGGKGCSAVDERMANPGSRFTCDDKRGSFREIKVGCYESCYIIGPNDESVYMGTNNSAFCAKKPPKFSVPVPVGWGTDGYPIDPEMKGIL